MARTDSPVEEQRNSPPIVVAKHGGLWKREQPEGSS